MEKDISDWVNRVSQLHDDMGKFSICPFAKKAFEDKKIFWSYISYEVVDYISRYMEEMQDYELVLFYNTDMNLTNDDCVSIIAELNLKFSDVIFLKDHPDAPGYIRGHYTGNGKYPVILAQPKGKLLEAREKLNKAGYYDNWDPEYKNEIWSYK